MSLRIGVDVGGTFTKAVAFDTSAGAVTARSVVATTHDHPDGVAAGVVEAVAGVAERVGPGEVGLVTHSTTQAVNALLEGDVGTVGVIALGRSAELRRVARRTRLGDVRLAPGHSLATVQEVLDVTGGLDVTAASAAIDRVKASGAVAVCVAEAFAPDDDSRERAVADLAAAAGLPACTSSELTGVYGLELRTVTAALNASIVPIAVRTAGVVEEGVARVGVTAPVMVMRGDGGATDLAGFRRAPARTLYSGPAASVAGALRFASVADGVVVEVGGTSTNVAAVRSGRPELSYVRVASHATALRAIDVRVVGVAGGSMLRVRRRRVYGVGPRSAHIAGLPYSCFAEGGAAALDGAEAVEIAPRPGDPADYLVVEASGRRYALTNTCAANLLGIVKPGDYAAGSRDAARAAFEAAGRHLRLDADEVARRMLEASGRAVGELVSEVAHDHSLARPTLLAVGGGAGGLGRHVAALLGLDCVVPDGAEVISSIGDALSLVRAERERSTESAAPADFDALVAEVEQEAVASGASPASLEVRVDYVADRKVLRAVAQGSVGLESGARPGREALDREALEAVLESHRAGPPEPVGAYWVAPGRPEADGRVVVLDRFGDLVLDVHGEHLAPDPTAVSDAVARHTRQRGPMAITPSVWVLSGTRLTEAAGDDLAAAAVAIARSATERTGSSAAVVVGRE
ncbi:MAG: methylhydantoinase [Acidimicrobiia bacterium]|nr:methylhydantoinase [Acidimicrobiia bacterium]